MEDSLNEEVQKLLDNLRPKANKAISLRNTFNISIVNALWSIVIGEKLDLNDPKLMKTVELFDAFNRSAEGPTSAAANLIPFPKLLNLGLVKKALGLDQLEAFFGQVLQMVKPAIDNHKSTLDENNIRDFMDLYLLEISKTSDPKSSFHPQNGLLSLQNLMIDLFIAGTETTSSSLLWAFYFLLKYPECQPKIYQEILEQVGHNRLASLEDRPQMHFTNAFLLEAMRTGTLTPLSVFHYTFTDINIKGFTIPKNSTIIGSTYHVHFDPELFPEPDKFKPQRFLDADGKFVTDEHVIPFGVGKRYCLGKSLAEKEYFLFFVGMVQHFEIGNVEEQKLPGYLDVPCPGLIRSPLDFQLILKPRFDQ